ncbi:MAG: hypothetical protein MZV63_50350 [Marinilabiliales bacterium]|nr:hypothetical protein [Marinilabiliales bacterium]
MIIAINARTLRAVPHDGIGWFTHEVVRGIVSCSSGAPVCAHRRQEI